jgi:hemerythrin-like domain-containing protein
MNTNNHNDNLQYKLPYSKSGWNLQAMPVGYLMIEHRLIEKMIALLEKELGNIRKTKKAKPKFIDTAVDFIKTYADKCHHGKELVVNKEVEI